MPEHAANRFIGLYDQQNENRIPDWGGDELFTRMPRRRAVDDAPAPRFRPSLVLLDTPEERRVPPAPDATPARLIVVGDDGSPEPADAPAPVIPDADESVVAAVDATIGQWDGSLAGEDPRWEALLAPPQDEIAPNGRRTKVITGRPEGTPRPLSLVPPERRRPRRTPAEWIGGSPERIMGYAFLLGLLLIIVAISTADA